MQTKQQKKNEEALNRWMEQHPIQALIVTVALAAAISLPMVYVIIERGWTF